MEMALASARCFPFKSSSAIFFSIVSHPFFL
jgi:hypothetical protein